MKREQSAKIGEMGEWRIELIEWKMGSEGHINVKKGSKE